MSTGGVLPGGSIVVRDARGTPMAIGLWPLVRKWSGSRPMWHVWACMCLPIGSTNRMPSPRWWAHLTQAAQAHKQRHPDDDFALLHHRKSTLLHGFQALFYAPLLGIDRLSEFDTREHPLQTL